MERPAAATTHMEKRVMMMRTIEAGSEPICFMAYGSPSTPAPSMLATMMLELQQVRGGDVRVIKGPAHRRGHAHALGIEIEEVSQAHSNRGGEGG